MKKSQLKTILPGALLLLAASCGGTAGETASASTRNVTGSLGGSGAALVRMAASDSCLADNVIVTDTLAQSQANAVADDCSFSLSLETGTSYAISFTLNGEFVAALIFDSGAGLTASAFNLADGESALDLGSITLNGSTATAGNNPLDQNDSDDDGVSDLDDDDDDNDGTPDEIEDDCDLDGVNDDWDEDDSDDENCGASENDEARVLEVKPRNDPQTEDGEDRVDLDKKVRARIACEIDPVSVTAETFSVVAENGTPINCTYEFSDNSGRSQSVTCRHDDEDFTPDSVYTASLDGVLCVNGDPVQSRSWSWLTEDEDDDEGDTEDELDDSLEDDESDDGSDDESDDDDSEDGDDDGDDEEDGEDEDDEEESSGEDETGDDEADAADPE